MKIVFKDDALEELFITGKTRDSKYKQLCKDKKLVDGYIRAVKVMATKSDNLVPARAVHPGEVLREELRERGLKQKDFAQLLGVRATHLNEFLKGKRNMSVDLALKLETHLGIPYSFWMSLHNDYLYDSKAIDKQKEDEKSAIEYEHACQKELNLKILYSRLGITGAKSIDRVSSLRSAATFDILSTGKYYQKVAGMYKHSTKVQIDERNMMTWLVLNRIAIEKLAATGCYKSGDGYKAAKEIAQLANLHTLSIASIKEILNRYGILYAEVAKVDKAPIDAFSTMKDDHPVITVTYRYNDMDKLAFDILHELYHIENHLNEDGEAFISVDGEEYSSDPREKEANVFAMETLIPTDTWNKILGVGAKSLSPYSVVNTIATEAQKYNISPSIAVSRYKHDSNWYKVSAYRSPKIV
jgi:HTH-type transcriptional regulator/antitoxin HigA